MSTSRIVYVTLVILIAASLIGFIRGGAGFPIVQVLPFAGGPAPALYSGAGVVMILITIWGIRRLQRNRHSDTQEEDDHES